MLSVLRQGDIATCGHIPVTGSPNVFANDLGLTRVATDPLNCPIILPFYFQGLNTVFVNDQRLVHIGDTNNHGGIAIVGSPDVFGDDVGPDGVVPPPPGGVAVLESVAFTDFNNSYQPGANRAQAAQLAADDTDVDGPGTGSGYAERTVQRYEERSAGQQAQNETVAQVAPPPTGTPPPPNGYDCTDIQDKLDGFDWYNPPFQLSPNFTVAQVSTNTLVSNYKIKAQLGMTEADIVCNLRALCYNVLEPLRTRYGSNLRINSAFRTGTGTSQHYKGEAVDVSFTDASSSTASFARAQEITNDFNYDQFIYEQNNSIWLHISYKATGGQRRQILTKPRGNKYLPGLQRITT